MQTLIENLAFTLIPTNTNAHDVLILTHKLRTMIPMNDHKLRLVP